MSTKNKQIIIMGILSFTLLILIVGYLAIQKQKQINNNSAIISFPFQNNPTGVIIPTSKIKSNELDIVNIQPKDSQKNISLDAPITITFSRAFEMKDIEFFLSPDTPASVVIEKNLLLIRPTDSWIPGTTYSYSVNFISDVSKVRLYSFTTTGPSAPYLPDTATEDYFQSELQKQKETRADMYVANQTPYETNIFKVTSEYTTESPAHFYFTVISKTTDQEILKQEFKAWLQSLDLKQDQIDQLDIRY